MIERPKLPPARFVRALDAFRGLLLRVHRGLFPGNVVLYEHFQHFWLLPSLYVAARLDIARHLEKEPLSAAGIAGKTGSDPGNIERLMRALESQGIFRRDRNGLYRLNALSRPLLEGPGSLRYMIMHHLGPVNWNLMSSLEYAVRTGRDSFSKHYGMATYEYLRQHPDEHLVFDRSMSDLSDLGLSAILSARNFREFSTIADIGGGEGFLLASILRACPASEGILFDTADALEKAPALLERYGVTGRTRLVPGDFFDSVPLCNGLYILKNILHNWDDNEVIRLLGNIHRVAPEGATLMIIELVVPEGPGPSLAKLLDIQMMATMPGGRERTAAEYRDLLRRSGFECTRITGTVSPVSLIEARKTG